MLFGLFHRLLRLMLTCCLLWPGASAATELTDCVDEAVGAYALVKIDREQQRLFLTAPHIDEPALRLLIDSLNACFNKSTWDKRWSFSVFNQPHLAGYKTDADIIAFHKNDQWSKGYLAEYNSASKILILMPMTHAIEIHIE
ncbi:hypothetical protein [Kaarinaea lacus]